MRRMSPRNWYAYSNFNVNCQITSCSKQLSVLQSRRNAVHKKYMQYVGDATFRRAFQARIYYNVNRDAPAVAENGPQWSQHGDAPTKELSHVRRCNAVRMRGGQSGASSERRVQWPTGLTRTRGPYQEASVDSLKADMMMFERFNFDSVMCSTSR